MDMTNVLYFLLASVALTLMPGPDILFVATQSMVQGKKGGIMTALGLCTGLLGHTAAVAVGISAVIYHSELAFQILKYFGAAYLLFLAWQSLKSSGTGPVKQTLSKQSAFALYKRGIWMNLLNPKVSIFFLAFLPQFVSPHAGSVTFQFIGLGMLFILQALTIFGLVSVGAGALGEKFLQPFIRSRSVHWIEAAIYTILGLRLVFMEK
jgi:threonine/homoserine/homoserine lactone efflux protein